MSNVASTSSFGAKIVIRLLKHPILLALLAVSILSILADATLWSCLKKCWKFCCTNSDETNKVLPATFFKSYKEEYKQMN